MIYFFIYKNKEEHSLKKEKSKEKNDGNSKIIIQIIAIFASLTLILGFLKVANFSTEIPYSEFLNKIENGEVEAVEIGKEKIKINLIDDKTVYTTGLIENDDNLVKELQEAGVIFEKNTNENSITNFLFELLIGWGPTILLLVIFLKMLQKNMGGIMNAGKANPNVVLDKNTKITFKDVAGQEEAKEQLVEVIDYLHNPDKYKGIGAKLPKGVLLVGPPGTGKTLLAKAVAGEANVPFFSITGSDFIEMYAGVGASRVRDLFKQAQKQAPCIIFIDEVDTIAKKRGSDARGSNDEREQTLNQLLSEIDGFDSSKGIVVLAATNRPETLDKAFLRTGRFDRKVIVDKPDFKGRVAIFKVHAKNVKIDKNVDFEALSKATAGGVGADIANIINEGALRAVKIGHKTVMQEDLLDAVETVFAGKEKKDRVLSSIEKKIVAYHEIGHAVVSALQKDSAPIQKITIIPRTMGALGYTMQVPEEEKYLLSKEDMLNEITTLLGGRGAEDIFFNSITTGASNDIARATEIARKMVTMYGMSEKIGLVAIETNQNAYLDDTVVRNCSETTSTLVDKEIMGIVSEQYDYAKKLISSNKELIVKLADYLLEKESISGDEFMAIFNKYPHNSLLEPAKQKSEIKVEASPKAERKEKIIEEQPIEEKQEIEVISVVQEKTKNVEKMEKKEDTLVKTTPVKVEKKKDFNEILVAAKQQTIIENTKDEETETKEKKTVEKTVRISGANSKPTISPGDIDTGYSNKPSSSVFGPSNRKPPKKPTNKPKQKTNSDMETLLKKVNNNKQSSNNDITEDMY